MRGEAGRGAGDYLVKSAISRFEIPRKFSTFALTSSVNPPAAKHRRRWSEGPLEREGQGPGATVPARWRSDQGGQRARASPEQTSATGLRTKHMTRAHCVKNEKTRELPACAARRAHNCPGRTQDLAAAVSQTRNIPGQLKRASEACTYRCGPGSVSAHAGAAGGARGPARLHRGKRAGWQRCPPPRRGSGSQHPVSTPESAAGSPRCLNGSR